MAYMIEKGNEPRKIWAVNNMIEVSRNRYLQQHLEGPIYFYACHGTFYENAFLPPGYNHNSEIYFRLIAYSFSECKISC